MASNWKCAVSTARVPFSSMTCALQRNSRLVEVSKVPASNIALGNGENEGSSLCESGYLRFVRHVNTGFDESDDLPSALACEMCGAAAIGGRRQSTTALPTCLSRARITPASRSGVGILSIARAISAMPKRGGRGNTSARWRAQCRPRAG